MADLSYTMKLIHDFRDEASSSTNTISCNKIKDLFEISVSRIGYKQVFRRDRSSPLETMSAFIASEPDDLR
jgi:hypothetical protein